MPEKVYAFSNGTKATESELINRYGKAKFAAAIQQGVLKEVTTGNQGASQAATQEPVPAPTQNQTGEIYEFPKTGATATYEELVGRYGKDKVASAISSGIVKKKGTTSTMQTQEQSATTQDQSQGVQSSQPQSQAQSQPSKSSFSSFSGGNDPFFTDYRKKTKEQIAEATVPFPDGANVYVNPKLIPAPYNASEYTKGLKERVSQKSYTPEDVEVLAKARVTSPEATKAYLDGKIDDGRVLEISDRNERANQALYDEINKMSAELGIQVDAKSLADNRVKLTEFLNNAKLLYEKKSKEAANRIASSVPGYTMSPVGEASDVVINNRTAEGVTKDELLTDADFLKINESFGKLQSMVYDKLMDNIERDDSIPYDKKSKELLKYFNPQKAELVDDAVMSQIKRKVFAKVPIPIPKAPGDAAINEYIFGKPENNIEILFADMADAEQSFNEKRMERYVYEQSLAASMKRGMLEKLADGSISEEEKLKMENSITSVEDSAKRIGVNIKSDEQLFDKYPYLLKKKVADVVNEYNAITSGNVVEEGESVVIPKGVTLKDWVKSKGFDVTDQRVKDVMEDPDTYLKDYSKFGKPLTSVLGVFKSAVRTINDLTPFDGGEALVENMRSKAFPNSVQKEDKYQLTTGASIGQNIGNTTGQVIGQGLFQYATGGLGRLVGMSKAAAASTAFWSSGFAGSYDSHLQDSYDLPIESGAGRALYAGVNAMFDLFSEKIFPDVKIIDIIPGIRNSIVGIAQKFSKGQMSEQLFKELMGGVKSKALKYVLAYGKNVGQDTGEEMVTSLFNDITKMAIGDPNTDFNTMFENVKETAIQTAIGTSAIGILGARADLKRDRYMGAKSTIFNSALYHDEALDAINRGFQKGEYNEAEKNQKLQILNTARSAYESMRVAEKDANVDLSRPNREVYVANLTAEAFLKEQRKATDDPMKILSIDEKIKNLQSQRQGIMAGDISIDEDGKIISRKETTLLGYNVGKSNVFTDFDETLWDNKKQELTPLGVELRDAISSGQIRQENVRVLTKRDATAENVSLISEQLGLKPIFITAGLTATEKAEIVDRSTMDKVYFNDNQSELDLANSGTKVIVNQSTLMQKDAAKDMGLKQTVENVKRLVPQERLDAAQSILDRVNNAEYINENEISKAEDELYTALEAAPEAAHLIEPLIQQLQSYEFTTKTETGTVTETVATKTPRKAGKIEAVKSLKKEVGSQVDFTMQDGTKVSGTLEVRDGMYVIENGDDAVNIGEVAMVDRDFSVPQTEDSPIVIGEDGTPSAYTLQINKLNVQDGTKQMAGTLTVKNRDAAIDQAIAIRAERIGEVSNEDFDIVYEEVQREYQREVLKYPEKSKEAGVESASATEQAGASTQPTGEQAADSAESAKPEKKTNAEKLKAAKEKAANNEGVDGGQAQDGETVITPEIASEKTKPEGKTSLKTKLINDGKRVVSVLQKLKPGLKVVVLDNDKQMTKAIGSPDRGAYVASQNTIYLNVQAIQRDMDKFDIAKDNVAFHEGVHPILDALMSNDKEIVGKLFNQIVALRGILPGVDGVLAYASTQAKRFGRETGKEEAVVEFISQIANGDISLNDIDPAYRSGIINQVKDIINKFLKVIGVDREAKNLDDIIELSKMIREAFVVGTEIAVGQSEVNPDKQAKRMGALGDLRDNKHFKFSDLKYPDVVFGDIQTDDEADVAISFYDKMIKKFNKDFGRDVKMTAERKPNGGFSIVVTYETGTQPKYFAYPTSNIGEHQVVDSINNDVPLTSLRHELIHEMLVKHITDKFERINNIDNSANALSVEEVQRNRAYNYTLEDVFFERVVENIERVPDGVDTFDVSTYGIDVTNRLYEEIDGGITKDKVMSKLSELLEGANPWLQKTLTDIFNKIDYSSVSDIRDLSSSVGSSFKSKFNVSRDILPNDLQRKIYDFTNFFNEEYQGVQTRLAKNITSKGLSEFVIGAAPFRYGNIKTIDSSSSVFESKKYRQWMALAKKVAEELGIKVVFTSPTIGIYSQTSSDMEASAISVIQATDEMAEVYAAVMGVLAPESQHSIMMNKYDREGLDTEYRLSFKTMHSAQKFLKSKLLYGVQNVSFDPSTKTALVLDIPEYNATFNQQKFIQDYATEINGIDRRNAKVSFVEEGRYGEIVQRAWDTIQGLNGGVGRQNLIDIYRLSLTRLSKQSGDVLKKSEQKKKLISRSYLLKQNVYNYITKYKDKFGLKYPKKLGEKRKFNPELSREIHDAYDTLQVDNSSDSNVMDAYQQLVKEIDAQYKYMTEDIGIAVTFMENDPYENSDEMMADVYNNKHLKVFKGGEPHPFLDAKDSNGVSANEKFRAVHDYFGHAVEDNQFGKIGEDAAWLAHSKMFSPLAQKAMSTETRGQNSWVNNDPVNKSALEKFARANDLIKVGEVEKGKKLSKEAQSEFQFATQKVDILPENLINPYGQNTGDEKNAAVSIQQSNEGTKKQRTQEAVQQDSIADRQGDAKGAATILSDGGVKRSGSLSDYFGLSKKQFDDAIDEIANDPDIETKPMTAIASVIEKLRGIKGFDEIGFGSHVMSIINTDDDETYYGDMSDEQKEEYDNVFSSASSSASSGGKKSTLADRISNMDFWSTGQRSKYSGYETFKDAGVGQKGRPPKGETTTVPLMVQQALDFINQLNVERGDKAISDLMTHFKYDENRRLSSKEMEISGIDTPQNFVLINTLFTYVLNTPISESKLSPIDVKNYTNYLRKLSYAVGRKSGQALNAAKIRNVSKSVMFDMVMEGFMTPQQNDAVVQADGAIDGIISGEIPYDDDALATEEDMEIEKELEQQAKQSSAISKIMSLAAKKKKAITQKQSQSVLDKIKIIDEEIKNLINKIDCK